ncbi:MULTISPECIES: hypothetical protein [Nocardiaceae]|uniref:hypothetical protein n=1 Tax=Nocardiaceae TaxID=85025 RepID=UPI00050CF792|nr:MULTISPECIES: hypothetical protein [Rhodococcus]OZC41468.1 hypothetical protein CH289_27675 [Rhodococcus sp. RS1C4]OZC70917.1 hypothetical protein CH276_00185 [Rhodococcus sp. 06-470-2]OZC75484.1 hypothetical protein CH274_21245 [Rhodococcus sp. 06-418-5]OZC90003.1 hypothetical protein CH282_03160 [Rhodococcus sp. 06-418-1B]OZC94481.1 hypothetical protein CH254_00165 [Rhodococcus sp. 06-412-2C]
MAPKRPDETLHRLRDWTHGQLSERLAAQILLADDFKNLDPSQPMGGPDNAHDAIAHRDGKKWVMAAYFPNTRKTFSAVKKKFLGDVAGVATNGANGIVFVTNQALTVGERTKLSNLASCDVELYHLERCVAILDMPRMGPVRRQFYLEDENSDDRVNGNQTGGDTTARFMLSTYDMKAGTAQHAAVLKDGQYPLYDLSLRIVDMNVSPGTDLHRLDWGNLVAPAEYYNVNISLPDSAYWRIFFTARNGQWHQDLILKRSDPDSCWLAATRVIGLQQAPHLQQLDLEFIHRFGAPEWLP